LSSPPRKTFRWRVDPLQPCRETLVMAASIVRSGGIVIYPTETFYALGGDPSSEPAVKRIYAIKERDMGKPLPLIADCLDSARRAVKEWPVEASHLAKQFWPGPLTLILPLGCAFPFTLHGGSGNIALRVSSHPLARALAALSGGWIISTSANKSGEPPFSDLRDMPPPLEDMVDGILDGGTLPGERPSTIVDLTRSVPQLLREGAVPWEKILRALAFQRLVPRAP